MSRKSNRRSALATTAQLLVVAVLAIAIFVQVSLLSNDATMQVPPPERPDEVAPEVIKEQEDAAPFMTTDEVNLRNGPGIFHDVIKVLPVKTDLVVTGQAREGFVPIRVDGTSAWISTTYIAPAESILASTIPASAEPTVGPDPTAMPTVVPTMVPTAAPAEVPVEIVVEAVEDPSVVTAGEVLVNEAADPEPPPDAVTEPTGERWVEVDRTTATVTLHQGNTIVAKFQGLIGKDPSPDGYYSTATGTFDVFSMEKALTETPFAPGVYLSDWVGFDPERSNGFHSPTRDEHGNVVQTGGTATLGCVRLGEQEAIQLFNFAFIGMRVEIHD